MRNVLMNSIEPIKNQVKTLNVVRKVTQIRTVSLIINLCWSLFNNVGISPDRPQNSKKRKWHYCHLKKKHCGLFHQYGKSVPSRGIIETFVLRLKENALAIHWWFLFLILMVGKVKLWRTKYNGVRIKVQWWWKEIGQRENWWVITTRHFCRIKFQDIMPLRNWIYS